MKTKILDCTLRDGGYYNDWNFSNDLVSRYLSSMAHSGVSHVELGLRTPSKANFFGPYAFCSENFLKSLPLEQSNQYGVMINAKEYIVDGQSDVQLIEQMFTDCSQSSVSFVRIASHAHEITKIQPAAKKLSDLGYEVVVNIMQIATLDEQTIANCLKDLGQWGFIKTVYFADSLGSMDTNDIDRIINLIKKDWSGEIGIHAHNNKNQALQNTIYSATHGVSWLDCTVTGMGRGAGNCPTEYLVMELSKKENFDLKPEALFGLVLDNFGKLKAKHGWGPNLLYYLSADYEIHPTYTQKLLSQDNVQPDQLILAMERLKESDTKAFRASTYSDLFSLEAFTSEGTWSPESELAGREVLILGSGPQLADYSDAVLSYIKANKPIVLNLNVKSEVPAEYIDYYVACNPTRIITNLIDYKGLAKPLIAPEEAIKNVDATQASELSIKNFGLKINSEYQVENNHCLLKDPLAYPYALSVCVAGKASNVLLAGFDGYPESDYRYELMSEVNDNFVSKLKLDISCVTPSNFRLPKKSIFSMV